MWSRRNAVLLVAAMTLLAGCGDGGGNRADPVDRDGGEAAEQEITAEIDRLVKTPAASYVGKVEGTDAYIAVVDRAGEIEVYMCDNAGLSRWFAGDLSGGQLSAADGRDGKVSGRLVGNAINGTVVLGERSLAFAASEATFPAGLWQTLRKPSDRVVRFGWVVLPDGSQRGARSGTAEAVGPVDTSSGTADPEADGTPNTVTPSEPQPQPGGTGGTAGLCRQYQDTYKVNKIGAKEGGEQGRKTARRLMLQAQSLWNADCQGIYGNIDTAQIPTE